MNNAYRLKLAMLAGALVTGLLGGATAMASEVITVPDCRTLERIAAGVDGDQQIPLNRWAVTGRRGSGVSLSKGLQTPGFEQAFGKDFLSWQQADFRLFAPAANNCMKEATKQKRFEAQKAINGLRQVVQYHMNKSLRPVQRAETQAAKHLQALEGVPGSIDQLRIYSLLSRMGELDRQQVSLQVISPIERMRTDGATAARLLANEMLNLPQTEADRYLERIGQSRSELADGLVSDLQQTLTAAEAGLQGLVTVFAVEQQVKSTLQDLLPAADIAALEDTAGNTRERIWAAWEPTLTSVDELESVTRQHEFASLSAQDQRRLQDMLGAALDQAAQTLIADTAEKMKDFDHSLEGLRDMVAYTQQMRGQLKGPHSTQARQALENAYHEYHQAGIEAVQDEFEEFLEDLPESADGMRLISTTLKEIDAPRRSELYRIGAERARQIGHLVEQQRRREECATALPGLDLDEDDAQQLVIGPGKEQLHLGEVLCDIALAGSTVHSYEPPGFFSDDHTLEITGRDGVFYTYTLQAVKAGPDTEALMGVSVTDPGSERTLDIAQWKSTLGKLLPGGRGSQKDRCEVLMNKPESELTTNDRMAAMSCVMNSLLGK